MAMTTIEVLDPTGELDTVEKPLAPRDGTPKRVAFVDIRKPRGDVFLDELERVLRERGIDVFRTQKPTFTKPAPPDVRRDIAREREAVVEALAD